MVKDLNQTVDRWQRKVQNAEQDYVDGIANPGKDWQSAALAAEGSYEQGVIQSIQNRDWARGVSQVSTQDWQTKTLEKSGRWRQGVNVAGQDYANSMATVLQNVQGATDAVDRTVGPRGPKGSEQNIARSVAFQREMHARTLAARGQASGAGSLVMEPISIDISRSPFKKKGIQVQRPILPTSRGIPPGQFIGQPAIIAQDELIQQPAGIQPVIAPIHAGLEPQRPIPRYTPRGR